MLILIWSRIMLSLTVLSRRTAPTVSIEVVCLSRVVTCRGQETALFAVCGRDRSILLSIYAIVRARFALSTVNMV